MDAKALIEAYFAAWDAHDPQAVVALFADGGTYEDPAAGRPLSGAAIGEYAQGLFTAFPDLKLELIGQLPVSAGQIAVPWLLFGTHRGPLGDTPPTGKSIVLRGCDFISVADGKLQVVYGVFSLAELNAQLGG